MLYVHAKAYATAGVMNNMQELVLPSTIYLYRSQVSNKIVKTVKLGSKKLSLSTDPMADHFVCVLFWTHGVFYYVVKAVLEFMIFLTQTSRDTHVSHLVIGFLSNLWNKWMHVSFKTLQISHFLFIQFLPRKLALGITKIRKLTLLYYHANCRHHVAHTNHLFLRMLFWHVLNFIDVLIHVPTTTIRKQHGQISLRTLSPTAEPSLPPRGGQLFSFVES